MLDIDADEALDFSKLGKDLNTALEMDNNYQMRNKAKFQAVEQRVGSYEEFRDMVNAAHLRPLDKKDKKGQWIQRSWNSSTQGLKANSDLETLVQTVAKVSDLPSNGYEFLRDWQVRCKTGKDRFNLLKQCGGARLREFFKTDIIFSLLGNILVVLDAELTESPTEFASICDTLKILTTAKGFTLANSCLSEEELCTRSSIMSKLHSNGECDCDVLNSLNKAFGAGAIVTSMKDIKNVDIL